MLSRLPRACALCGLLVGGGVLLGWLFDVPALKSVFPGLATCKPNTAASMFLAGLALFGLSGGGARPTSRWTSVLGAGLETLLTLATLLEYATGFDLRVDEVFFRAPPGAAGSHPMRMAIATALGFFALGIGLLLLCAGRVLGAQIASLAAAAPALLALVVYTYDLRSVAAFVPISSVALHTAGALLVLSVGLFWARPGQGMPGWLLEDGASGVASRRLLPLALAVPIVTGRLCLWLGKVWSGLGAATSPFVALTALTLGIGVVLAALALQRHERLHQESANALRVSEERFRGIVETLPYGMGLRALDGKLEYVSPQLERYSGLSFDRLMHEGWISFVHPDDREMAQGHFRRAVATSTGVEFEERILRHDGVYRWNLVRATLLRDGEGGPRGWVVTLADVDDERATRLSIEEHARLMQRSNRELRRFSEVIARELRGPLDTIVRDSAALSESNRGQLPHEADEFLAFIREGAARMQSLVDGLLAYAVTDDPEGLRMRVEAGVVFAGVLGDLGAALEKSGARVHCAPLPVVFADPLLLAQVFSNLLGNAIKYRRVGVPPEIWVDAEEAPEGVRFAVRDNGLGIEAEHGERIFQLFRRLHGRQEYDGTGIGLAICKRIVERQGGRIWVESTPGKGATFFFTLPPMEEDPRQGTLELGLARESIQ